MWKLFLALLIIAPFAISFAMHINSLGDDGRYKLKNKTKKD
jgi:hypothetical protein